VFAAFATSTCHTLIGNDTLVTEVVLVAAALVPAYSHNDSASTRGASDASSKDGSGVRSGSRGGSSYVKSGKPCTMSEKLTTCVVNVGEKIAVKMCVCMCVCATNLYCNAAS